MKIFTVLSLLLLVCGCTVPSDPGDREAARWMRIAAEDGNAYAQYNFAMCCLHGDGVPQDRELALKYLHLAAENGYSEAVDMLKQLKKSPAGSGAKTP